MSRAWVKSRIEFFKNKGPKLLLIATMMVGVAFWVKTNIRIGLEAQMISCLPWSLYYYSPNKDFITPARGQLVRVNLPKKGPGHLSKDLSARFEKGVPGGGAKIVVGMPGDKVTIKNNWLLINNEPWGYLWLLKPLQLPENSLDKEYVIAADHYLVLGTTPESYDSRYWGPLAGKDILGSIHVLL